MPNKYEQDEVVKDDWAKLMIDPGQIQKVTFNRDKIFGYDDIVSPYGSAAEYDMMSFKNTFLPAEILSPLPNLCTGHFLISLDHHIITRTNYNLLNWLGDAGALLGTLQMGL